MFYLERLTSQVVCERLPEIDHVDGEYLRDNRTGAGFGEPTEYTSIDYRIGRRLDHGSVTHSNSATGLGKLPGTIL